MIKNKSICANCKTGKESYELDSRTAVCPYLGLYKNNKCCYYKPLKSRGKGFIYFLKCLRGAV